VTIEFLLGFCAGLADLALCRASAPAHDPAARSDDARACRGGPYLAPAASRRLRDGDALLAHGRHPVARERGVFVPGLVMPTIIAIDVWQWTPFVTLIILAGLMSLPRSPFEAATMDGAGPWRQFVDILLPLMRPIIALVLLLRGIDAFKEFDKVFIMTGGGPGTVSELLSIYAYRVNFKTWNLGYGAAVSFMVYLVVLILCSVFYKAVYWKSASARA
jgi:multiple sugar transport system permease protein